MSDRISVGPGVLWSPEEYSRKETILSDAKVQFNGEAQQVIRCAECILARPTFNNEPSGFTIPEISRCTKIDPAITRRIITTLAKRDFLKNSEHVDAALHNFNQQVYTPQDEEDQPLFIPRTRLGCTRTLGQNVIEGLRPRQHQLLSHLMERGKELTIAQLQNSTGICRSSIKGTLKSFCRAKILAVEDSGTEGMSTKYITTEHGHWLFQQIASDATLSEPQKNSESWHGPLSTAHPELSKRLRDLYPPESYETIAAAIVANIHVGILRYAYDEDSCNLLELTPLALNNLGAKGKLAVIFYLGLAPLFDMHLTATSVRQILQLPQQIELADFIHTRYYLPLIKLLGNETAL